MAELGDLTRDAVLDALDTVIDPRSGKGLTSAGLVQALVLRDGRVGFMLEAPRGETYRYAPVRDEAEAVLRALPGIERAQVVLTTEGEGRAAPPPPKPGLQVSEDPRARLQPPTAPLAKPPHVKRIIAVASGKGGVGKSTVAVNLACAFAALGLRTGLADIDVYGPSLPRLMGTHEKPRMSAAKRMFPVLAHGVKCTSLGLIVEEGAAMIWRGPMASSAVNQLVNEADWGTEEEPLDILVIDLPPGTGDVLLTLAQKVAVDGAIIVSTPQPVALIDVRRGAEMFRKTGVAILGVIENMAYFPDPAGGPPIEIFGRGGAKALAEEIGAAFLGEIPIDIALRQSGDDGAPLVVSSPLSPAANVFVNIARGLASA